MPEARRNGHPRGGWPADATQLPAVFDMREQKNTHVEPRQGHCRRVESVKQKVLDLRVVSPRGVTWGNKNLLRKIKMVTPRGGWLANAKKEDGRQRRGEAWRIG
jgi:hypothetical protein